MERTINCQMVDVLCCSLAEVFCKIDYSEITFHVLLSNTFHPIWNGGREQTDLKVSGALLFALFENFLDVFFETKFEHDIGFIKDDCFNVREVNVSSFHVIKDTTSGTNE